MANGDTLLVPRDLGGESLSAIIFDAMLFKRVKILNCPGDFATTVKQINSQSDLIWMSSFAGPSYLTIMSSVYIILI